MCGCPPSPTSGMQPVLSDSAALSVIPGDETPVTRDPRDSPGELLMLGSSFTSIQSSQEKPEVHQPALSAFQKGL